MLFFVVAVSANSTSSGLLAFYAPSQVVYIESIQFVCRQLSEGVHQVSASNPGPVAV